jgi:hypothetical protein
LTSWYRNPGVDLWYWRLLVVCRHYRLSRDWRCWHIVISRHSSRFFREKWRRRRNSRRGFLDAGFEDRDRRLRKNAAWLGTRLGSSRLSFSPSHSFVQLHKIHSLPFQPQHYP